MPLSLRAYIVLATVGAVVPIMIDPLTWVSHATTWQLLLFITLVGLSAAGEHVSFQLHSGWSTNAGTAPHLATALLLPVGPAGLVAGLGMLIYAVNRRLSIPKAIFNTASVILAVEAASFAAAQLAGSTSLAFEGGWRGLVAAAVASSVYYVVSTTSVALVVALDQRRPVLEVLAGKVGVKAITEIGMGLLGGALAALLTAAPWFAPGLAAPALLAFLASRAVQRAARHARDLGLTSTVGRAVAGTLSLGLALDAITAREVRDALVLDGLALLPLADPPDFPVRVAADLDLEALRVGLSRHICAEAKRVHLRSRAEFPSEWIETLEPKRSIAAAAVPCSVGGAAPIGALVAWRTSDDAVEAFGSDELLLLETLADYAAVAIENARLFQEAVHGRATAEEREARVRAVMENVGDGLLTFDQQGRIESCNPAAERIFGRPAAQLNGASISKLLPGGAAEPNLHFELDVSPADGRSVSTEVAVTAIPHADPPRFIAVVHDISERKKFEEQLRHMAFHDHLTGLPNRGLFMDRVGHALARAHSHGACIAVLFVDLDNFKVVNDSLGHAIGDQLLTALSARLRSCLDPRFTLARFGGDEFTVLLEDLTDPAEAELLAQRIRQVLRRPITIAEREVFTTASIGIAISTSGQDSPGDLVRNADIAMYRAKRNGRSRAVVFDRRVDAVALERLQLETELRTAVDREQLEVHYQPIVDLRSGQVRDVEALVRWRHPEHGLIPPGEFIPLAEDTGLIIPMGMWVLETACIQLRDWQPKGIAARDLSLSVNLSARQFQHSALVDDIARVLRDTQLNPGRLMLEITESIAMRDVAVTADILARLKELGVRLAIDDFGTGYSSLSYLHRFPIDVLKIDRSFIGDISAEQHDAAIVRAIIALARGLDMEITAEGVETNEQLTWLREWGCDRGQGYYFSRPLPSELLMESLNQALGEMKDPLPAAA